MKDQGVADRPGTKPKEQLGYRPPVDRGARRAWGIGS